jgi:diguanylate cyclase (GGDEF)-like protein/PAS domain S-box-containing protein
MKLIEYLQSEPTTFLALVITIVSICIVIMVVIILLRLESEKKVTKAALELNKITNSIRAGLVHFVLEDNCKILYASKGFYDLLGYEKSEAKTLNKITLIDFIDPKGDNFLECVEKQLDNDTIRSEVRMIAKDGKVLNMLMNGNGSIGKDGRHTISVVFVDITEQKQMQDMILLDGERYRIATELSKDILFEYHLQKDEMVIAEKYRDLFGRNPIIQQYVRSCSGRREYVHPDDWGIYLELCQEFSEGKSIIETEFRLKDRLGDFIWCQLKGKTIYDDDKKPVRIIGKLVNVDVQKRELEALEYKATRDPLTGVYNKEVTIKKIDKFISGNKNNKHMLMFIDFDDFKKVNDTFGHLHGDKVLTYVISRIKEVFSEGEIIGRIGGDEFVAFSGNITSVEEVLKKAETLMNALGTTYTDDGRSIPISGSIGIAIYPEDGLHYEQLMERADKALYRVKEQGKNNYMMYSPTI